MAIEYSKMFLNITRRPSNNNILVAIPMYMYRIETNAFTHGLNFFEKTVLKFKANPTIKDEKIANYLGLDVKLIAAVVSDLKRKKLINEFGTLNNQGRETLKDFDGLLVDSSQKKIGYILQYIDQDILYPFYFDKLIPTDTTNGNKNHPEIIMGKKEDDTNFTETPFCLDELYQLKSDQPIPTEREILTIIQNTNKKRIIVNNENNNGIERNANLLSIRFINKKPELIWICTYIYLNKRDDETYDPEWKVLDPFGFGDNIGLKFYLSNEINNKLLNRIETKFSGVKTFVGKVFNDYNECLVIEIEERLKAYSDKYNLLDSNLRQYIKSIERNYILQVNYDFMNLDSSDTFVLMLQKTIENLIKLDMEKRAEYYNRVFQNFKDKKVKKAALNEIWKHKLFGNEIMVPKKLLDVSPQAKSLKSYLVALILTYNYDNNSILFKIFKNRIGQIVKISELRNSKTHGKTESEEQVKPLLKEDAEAHYNFIKSLINDYIKDR